MMKEDVMIHEKICAYYEGIAGDPHHRYRSWEHCYKFFRDVTSSGIAAQRHHAALQLGFYLASWGMYRGSTFLLQHAYTVHLKVVDCLRLSRFAPLWEREFGSEAKDLELVPLILEAAEAIKKAYSDFGQATETLVTKVLLGTFGCLPACDQYFIAGFRQEVKGYSWLTEKLVRKLLDFSRKNLTELRGEQKIIRKHSGAHYPLMKLLDMYFWQIGYEALRRGNGE
jgi:hypothetical protein